jgi:hypothetical protein
LPQIPYPKSDTIAGIRWIGDEIRDRNNGDVWSCTWADDGNLYAVADDTAGTGKQGWNLSIYKITGMPPGHKVSRVNEMKEYGPPGGARPPWWKGAGLASIDGRLYLGVYMQSKPSPLSASRVSYNADDSSIIASPDHGRTWTPTATTEKAMFPGKEFPTPFFVQYGKDYAGAMDEYVYLCSNDGGWNNWSRMMLARVPRKKFARLDRRDWEFFLRADAKNQPAWTPEVARAGAIFQHRLFTGMTGMQYVPAIRRFVLGQWSYVAMKGGGDRPCLDPALPSPWPDDAAHRATAQTMLCLYEAPKPWGPWRLFHAQVPWGPAFYNPNFPAKWFRDGGRRLWIVEGGNYFGAGGDGRGYCFTTREMELRLAE